MQCLEKFSQNKSLYFKQSGFSSNVFIYPVPSALISVFSLSCHVSSHSRKTTALFRVFSKPAWRLSPPSLSICVCVYQNIDLKVFGHDRICWVWNDWSIDVASINHLIQTHFKTAMKNYWRKKHLRL